MTLADLASLGSFVSGVAVLASLVFLFFQMRQMTEQVRQTEKNQQASIQSDRTNRLVDASYKRTEPHLRNIMPRGRTGDTTMSPEEVDAFLQVTYAGFLTFEDTYLQVRAGTINPDAWDAASARLRRILAAPGWRVAWKRWRGSFVGNFAVAVDQIISQARLSNWEEQSATWASDVAEEMRLSAK